MKICFTGDLFLGGDLKTDDGNVIKSSSYHSADLRIVNIEQAISSNSLEIEKSTLYASPSILSLLKPLHINVASLANNHIQDKGEEGIYETLTYLKKNQVVTFGAGKNISNAEKPVKIGKNLFILGYCEHSKSYLHKVQVSDTSTPGVNPFSFEKVIRDLNQIPESSKAILYLHWGREHIALPDRYHLETAKKLLKHPKVALIVGMHPHRIQGHVSNGKKKAYLSLGNFLFPNFFIKPRTQIAYPENSNSAKIKTTKDYHFVGELTYKVWRFVNRLSLLVIYDTEDGESEEVPVYQSKQKPEVKELEGFKKSLVLFYVKLLSFTYLMPGFIYNPIQMIYRFTKQLLRYIYVGLFLIRQNGLKWTFSKTIQYLKR